MDAIQPFSAWYRCIRGCPGRYDVFSVIYRCPSCGGLLEVTHDAAALAAAHSGPEWRDLFDGRARINPSNLRNGDNTQYASDPQIARNTSGVWAKHEWVLPQLAPENIVTLGEGFTPLLPSPRLGKALGLDDLWVKQCGVSHTGSFKDLGMTVLVSAVAQMMAGRGGVTPPLQGMAAATPTAPSPVRGRVCVHRRHLGRAGRLCRGRRHPGHRLPAQGQDQHRAAHPAHRSRRARPGARHRLRRLHEDRAGSDAR